MINNLVLYKNLGAVVQLGLGSQPGALETWVQIPATPSEMKEKLTSLDLRSLVPELKGWENSKVDKIYQPNPKEVHLHLYDSKLGEKILALKSGQAVFLTDKKPTYPKHPHSFCMLLRKHLAGSKLIKMEQKNFDRILELTFQREEKRKLIIELFSQGNIILCKDHQIIQPLDFQQWEARQIRSKVTYQYPPRTGENFFDLGLREFAELIKTEKEVVKLLAANLIFGGLYAEEICYRAKINKKTKGVNLKSKQLREIYDQILGLFIEDQPSVYLRDSFPYAFAPFRLKSLTSYELKEFDQFNQAIRYYFTKLEEWKEKEAKKEEFKKKMDKLLEIKAKQEKAIKEAKEKIKRYKSFADNLKKNLGQIKSTVSRIQRAKDSMSWEEIEEKYQIKFKPKKELVLKGIPIDLTKSVSDQMEDYYEKYKRFKKKLKGAKKAVKETEKKIKGLKEKEKEKVKEQVKVKVRKRVKEKPRAWYERFHWFYTSEGFLVIGGRNAEQNEELIKKHAEKNDIVFHATLQSPFCLIKTKGKKVGPKSLEETARFCASFSRAWKKKLGTIDVFWVKPGQLKPHRKKGAFRVKGERNYYRSVPLEIAIGLKDNKVIGGPVSAVKKQVKHYTIIKPGYEEVITLAKQTKGELKGKVSKERKKEITEIDLDRICKFIPGKGQITKTQ